MGLKRGVKVVRVVICLNKMTKEYQDFGEYNPERDLEIEDYEEQYLKEQKEIEKFINNE